MKTVFRFLVTATGLILILMALGIILLSTQVGSAADIAIERGLGFVYETKVDVDRVIFVPRESTMSIQGLTIYNPPPFKEGPAMEMKEVRVQLDPATILSAEPVVKEIVISGAAFHVRFEVGEGMNLGRLDKNASRLQSATPDSGGPALLSREYVIKDFHSEEAQLHVSANFVPGAGLNLTLAPFDVKGLSGPAPVSTTRMCTLFIRSVFREALSLRGLIQPAADKFNDELQRSQERDEAPAK